MERERERRASRMRQLLGRARPPATPFFLTSPLPRFSLLSSPQEVEARITKVIEEYKQTLMERTELHMG
jgi:hypothetical protein